MKKLSFRGLIPNIFTFFSLTLGITAIKFSIEFKWENAVACIVFASFLDNLDGKIARLLKSNSNFGVELDSLSDFVSFGISPVIVIYLWNLSDNIQNSWAFVIFYSICSASRLAKFNLSSQDTDKKDFKYFKGISTPAAAGLVLLPMMLSFRFNSEVFLSPIFSLVLIVLTAILMITNIPTYSLKWLKLEKKILPVFLIIFAAIVSLLISDFWLAMIIIITSYYISIPFAIKSYKTISSRF